MSASIERTERYLIKDLMLHLKLLKKTRTSKTQNKERNKKKRRAKINEIVTKKNHTKNQQNKELVL
jgi:hypothetical protein